MTYMTPEQRERLEERFKLIQRVTVDVLEEHYHKVRTAAGPKHRRPYYTAVVRADGDGPRLGNVVTCSQHERVDPSGDNVVMTWRLRGEPFLSRDEYEKRLQEKIDRECEQIAALLE